MRNNILIVVALFFTTFINSQNSLAKIEYSYAEEAFNNKNYAKAINHLEEVKKLLGSTNARILYLEILSRNNNLANYQSFTNSLGLNNTKNTVNNSNTNSNMPQSTINFINKNKKLMIESYTNTLVKYKTTIKNKEHLKNVTNLFNHLIKKLKKGEDVNSNDFLPSTYNNTSNNTSSKIIGNNKNKSASEINNWLNKVDLINSLCITYMENFENDVPLEKLKKIYEIKKGVQNYLPKKDLIKQAWESLSNKEYNLALSNFKKLQENGIESILVINHIQKTIDISLLDDKAIKSIEDNLILVKGNPNIFETTTKDGEIKSFTINDMYVSKYELTIKEYMYIVNPNNSNNISCENCPMSLSREKAESFIKILNKKSGKNYRLPTKEEWFWFATGGLKSEDKERGTNKEKSKNIDSVAWFKSNSDEERHSVGLLDPNELGLYDVWGNLSEITTSNSVGGSYTTKKKKLTKGSLYSYSFNWDNEEDEWSTMGLRLVLDAN